MHSKKLASIILRGPLEAQEIIERLRPLVSYEQYLGDFITKLLEHFGEGSRPSIWALSEWITDYQNQLWEELQQDADRDGVYEGEINLNGSPDLTQVKMSPDRFLSAHWKVPSITTLGALAHWLDLPVEHLDWFCGQMKPAEIGSKLSHYHITKIPKKSGGTRMLEVPKWEMKKAQRYVLDGILAHIPPHPCSHGFQQGRSIVTYVEPHIGQQIIIKFDLKDYFLTADRPRVRALFHLAGYPPHISKYLAHLCTHGFKDEKLPAYWKYERAHLPQGAPTSPAIADRLLFKLDIRLTGLAQKLNLNYTRYADDIAFSSSIKIKDSKINGLKNLVNLIIEEEGWWLNTDKTRVMKAGQRQRLAGLIVNTKANVARSEFDQLKAIIYRVKRNGLAAENRTNHPNFLEYLQGRISFIKMVNPHRAEKLNHLLESSISQH
ncbi:MAG: reverse transcriptase family protein [Akkermansiaceae bacterium]